MTYALTARRWSHGAAVRLAGLIAAMTILAPLAANATLTNYPQDTTLNMSGIGVNLTIVAGSKSDSLAVTSTTFTLTVASGDTFTIKWPGPTPGKFVNSDGVTDCNLNGTDNLVNIVGPKTTTITPTATPACGSGGGSSTNAATVVPAGVSLFNPNGAQSFTAGSNMNVQFSTAGFTVNGVRLSLSYDGGSTYPTEMVARTANFSSYDWVIPAGTAGTTMARVKAEALDGFGIVLATDTSDANFTIIAATPVSSGGGGASPTPTPKPTPTVTTPTDSTVLGAFDPNKAISNTTSIDADKTLTLPPGKTPLCTAGSLIQATLKTLYYCGADAKRYVFPNEATFKTWFDDFSSVVKLSDITMSQISLGGNITYRPGKRMVKVTTDPKVYAVARGGILRPLAGEDVARALYGANWNKMIDDLPDSFFVSYKIGLPITMSDVGGALSGVAVQSYVAPVVPTAPKCSSSVTFTANMATGSSDPQVLPLQGLLQCLGYIGADIKLNGYYGVSTTAGVKAFQVANSISALGSVGSATRAVLNEKY